MSAWTLCVDFGTAYSKAAAAPRNAWSRFDPASVRPLMIGGVQETGNAFLLESAVFVDDDRILFGRAAMARAEEAGRKRMALRSFKTLLSVSDLDRALNTSAPASVDPHRIFQMRDLIVLYLAYLLSAVDAAAAYDPMVREATSIERRYAAPAWRSGDSAGMHQSIVQLFGEAETLRHAVGDQILEPEGVPLSVVSDLLPKAMAAPAPYEMGLIFEATAAAAYTSIGLPDSGAHLIVIDMGAGTTDIAALARSGARLSELPEARVTLKQAGDFIDSVIANIVLTNSRWAKTQAQQTELWRAVQRHMRDIKEAVFEEGRATLRHDGRMISVQMRDIERDRDFKEFMKGLANAYQFGLDVLRDDVMARGRTEIQAIAVGGGAAAPFIRELIKKTKARGNTRVTPRPATPDWAHAREFRGNLAPVFPQLAISIGGALAPEQMLAAQGGVNPRANVQTSRPPARD
jgi:molecular chaperone DnaK (HSP70)